MRRCSWSEINEKMRTYHDEEWGVPVFDDTKQFEFLTLEVMQCGLSWNTVLQKREIIRAAFEDFAIDTIAAYDECDINRILAINGMIRSPRKIKAVIANAGAVRQVQQAFGTFSEYLWHFTQGNVVTYKEHEEGRIPPKNKLSERIAKDLKRRGFTYVGPVTIYSHLQACGIINDHSKECFRRAILTKNRKPVRVNDE
ncbi:DNA-3-methyladenine glycosylase I [Megasphaera vaginalis (ex Bordigoni et al. 2020)]|uniref:DNA-3-methyladenine glycosylase I n=1 Tax=Megasphaera vaginalis (ex Bordigoni et al. 2020) TaxID=2045301 RepID=UPI000C7BFFE8|nr:DNA-3-methyladenine glycosylase I [Megasphaera vaginalis (ex Bordigoni et al. 2020)]